MRLGGRAWLALPGSACLTLPFRRSPVDGGTCQAARQVGLGEKRIGSRRLRRPHARRVVRCRQAGRSAACPGERARKAPGAREVPGGGGVPCDGLRGRWGGGGGGGGG